MGNDDFLFLEHALPLFPLPLGIVASANFDKLGAFLLFLYHAMNSESLLQVSAAATQWAQIPIDFQLGHSPSYEKAPFF